MPTSSRLTGRAGRWRSRRGLAAWAALLTASTLMLAAQAPTADLVLSGGRVITVDDRFTIAEAVAVRGDRILAVGSAADVAKRTGSRTRVIDLRGRTVIPGLIDNHMHLLRAGTTWAREVRFDGVASRARAVGLLRARADAIRPGEWILSLGGWTVDQFADDRTPFTREELDAIAPRHPVLLQASYYRAYLNSHALEALGIADGATGPAWVLRDAAGRATGEIAEAGLRQVVARVPETAPGAVAASTRAMFADLSRAGLTSVGSAGCDASLLGMYRQWAAAGELPVRVFCITGTSAGSPQQVGSVVDRIPQLRFFQGGAFIDEVAYGEGVYGPLHDPMFLAESVPAAEALMQWRRIGTEIARAGLPLHVHANLAGTIDGFLDQIEQINREHPVRSLRWTFAHANGLTATHLSRMKKLGMYAAVHPWAVINGGINRRVYGEAAYDMAPLRTIRDSGITWGLGSDGSRANQILPFVTLAWAVTGRMVGAEEVLRQTISREDALIAHTRKNAYLVFREDDLGSIAAGKLADLVVLNRDYLSVPSDQIGEIASVLTMVGGRIVHRTLP
jgi:predicted amidohydrolase YtcJ